MDTEPRALARLSSWVKPWIRRAATREWWRVALVIVALSVAGQFYLAPASQLMWARDRAHLMSNGGDATTLPFTYDVIRRAARESPRNLLYGSIYQARLGPPNGSGMWVPWIERWLVVALGHVLPVEALPTAFVWILMILAGLCFYAFARTEHWPRMLAFAFALAYAFNAYTRARAVVHDALVAIYCLPLVFVALRLLKRNPTPAGIAGGATLLFLSTWTAHYYLLMLIAISPVFTWFQLRNDEVAPGLVTGPQRGSWFVRLVALAVAAVPAAAFLAWNYLEPIVPGVPSTQASVPDPEIAPLYMQMYAAKPIDYLAHDVGIGPLDLNPLRRGISEAIYFAGGNTWERANGIRWSILFPCLLLLVAMCLPVSRRWLRSSVRRTTWRKLQYWSVFAVLMFWFSLAPNSISVFGYDIGASSWVHALFSSFRVPSRFGPFVHFGVLALLGTYAAAHWNRLFGHAAPRWRRGLPCLLPVLMVLDYSPLQPVLIDQTYPSRLDLVAAGAGRCGVGIHFPYPQGAGSHDEAETYRAIQQMRRTDCQDLQQPLPTELHSRLLSGIGDEVFDDALRTGQTKTLQKRFVRFVQCARLDWVIFRAHVPEAWRRELCAQLQWQLIAPDACSSPRPRQAHFADPADACAPILEGR